MKPIRQLYLGVFLVDFLALALLFFSSLRMPNFFGTLGAGSLNSSAHSDQRRYVTVSAGIAEGYNVTLVSAEAQKAVEDVVLPDGVKISFSGENEMIMEAME